MFRFRLARVLEHRARRVQDEARELHRREAELRAVRRRREERGLRVDAALRGGGPAHAQVVERRLLAAWLDRQRAEDEADALEEGRRLGLVEEQRRRLLEAQREKSVLEKLRERQLRLWEEAERRREQKELDEVGARRRQHAAAVGAGSPTTGSGTP